MSKIKINIKKNKHFAKKTLKEWLFAYSFLAYPLILFAVFYVYVNFNSFIMAFQKINIDSSREYIGFVNFKDFLSGIFAQSGILKISFMNSIKIYLAGLVITLPLQLLFSYVLFKKCFAHKIIRILVMLPSIISSFVFGLVFCNFAGAELQTLMKAMGFEKFPNLIETSRYTFGTTLFFVIWISFSSSLIIYPNAMRAIDVGIFESAKIDGISTIWQEMRHIILPLIFPTISTFLIVGFSGIMIDSGSLVVFFMYDAPAEAYNMGYYMIVEIFNNTNPMKYPMVAAGGVILTAVIAPLTLILRGFLNKIDPMNGD